MKRNICFFVVLLASTALSAFAQGAFEVQPFFGYKYGGKSSVESSSATTLDINQIKFNSSIAYGVTAGVNFAEVLGVEFAWNRQPTKAVGVLASGGEYPVRIDANIDQFQGNLLVHFAVSDSNIRPYLLFGVGSTRAAGGDSSINKFSSAFGGGVKVFVSDNFGVRLQARYAPTYLYSTSQGVWCNWWGPCYLYANDKFAHQGDITAGWIVRF